MSQAKTQDAERYKLVDHNRNNTKEFETWQAAQEKMNDMVSMGASPENFEIQPVAVPEGTDKETKPELDEFEGEEKPDGGTPEPAQAEVVDETPENQAEPLPDRELTEDPIAWLQEGEGELTTSIKGTTVITKKGFRVLQHKYDISTGSEVLVGPEETEMEFCRVKAWAEMPDGRRAEAHASAHVDRGDDHYLLVSMADTRAKSRALSDVTGVGAVALEEMIGVADDE